MAEARTAVVCPECSAEIEIPITVRIEGDAFAGEQWMVCDPDLSDVWAHAWTHEPAAGDTEEGER
jgi:hypothetical protein